MTTQPLSQAESVSPISAPRRTLWIFSLVLVFFGLLVSGYLSYIKLTDAPMQCIQGSVFNCDYVQNSAYSRLAGIPIAWLGFGSYIVIGVLLLFQNRVAFLREYGMLLIFGIVLFTFIYSMWLVYVQFFLLEALCQWCLTHEAIMTVLFIVTSIRLKQFLTDPASV